MYNQKHQFFWVPSNVEIRGNQIERLAEIVGDLLEVAEKDKSFVIKKENADKAIKLLENDLIVNKDKLIEPWYCCEEKREKSMRKMPGGP